MSYALIDKLLSSFDELERCIALTKEVLSKKKGIPENVIQRVNKYSEIVAKQRALTEELVTHLANQNWEEVTRNVKLINALSAMIREDAQAILSGDLSLIENRIEENKLEVS